MRARLRGVSALVSVLTLAATVTAAPSIAAAAAGTWRLQTVVRPVDSVTYASFLDTAAISGTDAWAVGNAQRNARAEQALLVARWTGSSWQRVTAPSLSGAQFISGGGVSATSAGVWVSAEATFADRDDAVPFVARRTSSGWTTHTLPAGARAVDTRILGAKDVWVVYALGSGAAATGYGEHWDGTTWTTTTLPAVPDGGSSDGRWVSAGTRLLYLNGTRWTVMPGPHLSYAPGTAFFSGVLVRDGSLFVAVNYDRDGVGVAGTAVFVRSSGGTWSRVVFLPHDRSNSGLARTSAPGVWLLSDTLRHVVAGRVVASVAPPGGLRTELYSIAGSPRSATVFTAGATQSGTSEAATVATYRP